MYSFVYLALSLSFVFVFFFFQAEDGIRDDLVTGVQTCALPISPQETREREAGGHADGDARESRPNALAKNHSHDVATLRAQSHADADFPRSEERRVGKECRSRWAADH